MNLGLQIAGDLGSIAQNRKHQEKAQQAAEDVQDAAIRITGQSARRLRAFTRQAENYVQNADKDGRLHPNAYRNTQLYRRMDSNAARATDDEMRAIEHKLFTKYRDDVKELKKEINSIGAKWVDEDIAIAQEYGCETNCLTRAYMTAG